MGRRLYVGNLNYNTDEQTIRSAFEQFGVLKDVRMITDRETGRPKGFAFVEFTSEAEANAAIEQMNGAMLDGRSLKVNEAEDRRTGGGGGGGYRPNPNPAPRFNQPAAAPPPSDFDVKRSKRGGSRRRDRDDYDDRY